jgi:putative inorganic carbon (HCO3(-)) transporter
VLPLALVAAFFEEDAVRRTAAQVAAVMIGAGVVVTQNRSAWAGTLVALAVLGVLHAAHGGRHGGRAGVPPRHVVIPALLVLLGMGSVVAFSSLRAALGERAASALRPDDAAVAWRLATWERTARMIRERPLLGFGVGSYPLEQALYYHPAAPPLPQAVIAARGPSLEENAHNLYLQTAAELGIPGLALYLGVLIVFGVSVVRALPRVPGRLQRGMAMGALAAVAAQLVTAFTSPAWQFAECSVFLWVAVGVGVAAARIGRPASDGRLSSRSADAGEADG